MRIRLAVMLAVIVSCIAISAVMVFAPMPAQAVGSDADAICFEPGMCQYGTRCGHNGPPGVINKPCSDITNTFGTKGHCIAQFKCLADTTNGGSLTSIAQLLSGVSQLMQAMNQGGGGGGGGGGFNDPSCTQFGGISTSSSSTCSNFFGPVFGTQTSDFFNTSGINTSGDTAGDATAALISSLLGSGTNISSNSNSNSNANSNASSGSIVPGGSSSSSPSTTPPNTANTANLNPGTSASVAQTAFGASPGAAGDIQVISGNRITILASNRDLGANRQVSGFSGFDAPAGKTPPQIYTSLCAARPWSAGFLATIIPTSLLDNLCTSHGYSIVPPSIVSTPITTQSNAAAAPAAQSTPAPAAAPQQVGPLQADIWAVPLTIASGARANIFWSSSGAVSCSVKSDDNAFTANTPSGNATSPILKKSTTFTIECTNGTATASHQVTVTVQ